MFSVDGGIVQKERWIVKQWRYREFQQTGPETVIMRGLFTDYRGNR